MTDFIPRAKRLLKALRPMELDPTNAELIEMGKAIAERDSGIYRRVISAMNSHSAGEFPDAIPNPANTPIDLFDLVEQGDRTTPIASVNEYIALNILEGRIADFVIDSVAAYRQAHNAAGAAAATETVDQIVIRRSAETTAEAKSIVKG